MTRVLPGLSRGKCAALAVGVLIASGAVAQGFGPAGPTPASAGTPISTHEYSKGKGFDKCEAPTRAQMESWWSGSPYYYVGIYIGGSLRACPNENLTEGWVNDVDNMNWRFLPIWVGPQAPCSTENWSDEFSSDPEKARQRGHSAALYAKDKLIELGFHVPGDVNKKGPIVFYDLEGYDTTKSNCVEAVKAFIAGWTAELHQWRRLSGVYGPAKGVSWGSLWGINNQPDVVWVAQDNGTESVYGVDAPSRDKWEYQRLHQFKLNVSKTFNGVTMTIDINCARGRITGDNGEPAGDDPNCYS